MTTEQHHTIRAVGLATDGVLVRFGTATPLAGVREALDELHARGLALYVAANANGLLWRDLTGDEKYPDVRRQAAIFGELIANLPVLAGVPWFLSVSGAQESYLRAWERHLWRGTLPIPLYQWVEAASARRGELPREVGAALTHTPERERLPELAQQTAQLRAQHTAKALVEALEQAVSQVSWYVSAAATWRKPEPGMVLAAAELVGVPPQETAYVGSLPEDRAAAEAAGCALYVERLRAQRRRLAGEEQLDGGWEEWAGDLHPLP